MITYFQDNTPLEIEHVWHEDKGYRRQTILNKAILRARTEYIIFTDGDCVPRADFVSTHVAKAEPGFYLSGGYCKLSMHLSRTIDKDDILAQECDGCVQSGV